MKIWKDVVEDGGYVFIDQTETDLIFKVGEFDFKVNKYRFPPKKLSIRQCLTPREYCVYGFKKAHGDVYDYDDFEWVGKVSDYGVFKCRTHGKFNQIINNHLRGQGCFECFGSVKLTNEDVKSRCIESRGDVYDYSKLTYDNSRNIVSITCRIHGDFSANFYHHIKGADCNLCAIDKRVGSYLSNDEFERKARVVHLDKCDYSLVSYCGAKKKVRIICKNHGEFYQTPNDHLSGYGCKSCGFEKSGFTKTSYAKACGDGSNLYVMRMSKGFESFYKIGISKDVKSRISSIVCESGYDIEVVFTHHDSADKIFDLERHLHRVFKAFRYVPDIKFSGRTECFLNITEKLVEKEIISWYS